MGFTEVLLLVLVVAALAVLVTTAHYVKVLEQRLDRAKALLNDALASEVSAVKSGEIGAFDREQRCAIINFLEEEQ